MGDNNQSPELPDMATTALDQLKADQKTLLDTVDNLRQLGVAELVDLPQIVVVGDQSSGKSSVLEAISGIRFPAKEGLCTRFATELIMRESSQVYTKVHIDGSVAGDAESPLRDFSQSRLGEDEIPKLIEEAKARMGIGIGSNAFSEDVLRVETTGPEMLPLTLVDLPGFFHGSSANQSMEGKAVVERLAQKYIRQKNTIILAIVSATYSVEMQKVLVVSAKYDTKKERTLGIITKPDSLVPGSEQRRYIQLGKNEENEHKLQLGWHILRNRAESEAGSTDAERDAREIEFFATTPWSAISQENRGIEKLRKKLSKVLVNHIRGCMPELIQDIEEKMASHRAELHKLGESRSTPSELRTYLSGIASRFQLLSLEAVRGTYFDDFFGPLYPTHDGISEASSRVRKLRALVKDMNKTFHAILSTKGSRRIIQWDEDDDDTGASTSITTPAHLMPLARNFKCQKQEVVSIKTLNAELEALASFNQGTELPGSPNDRLSMGLFQDQSSPWMGIAKQHVELMINVAKSFVEQLLKHIIGSDGRTWESILSEVVDPFFETRTRVLHEKVEELFQHYKTGWPQPLEADYRANLSVRTKKRQAQQIAALLRKSHPGAFTDRHGESLTDDSIEYALFGASDGDISEFGTDRMIDNMVAYYDMCLKTFTDNVIILAIENCLIRELPELFTSDQVQRMDDAMLKSLAAESEDVRSQRTTCQRNLAALTKGHKDLTKFKKRESTVAIPQLDLASSRLASLTPSSESRAERQHRVETPPHTTPTPSSPVSRTVANGVAASRAAGTTPSSHRSLFSQPPPVTTPTPLFPAIRTAASGVAAGEASGSTPLAADSLSSAPPFRFGGPSFSATPPTGFALDRRSAERPPLHAEQQTRGHMTSNLPRSIPKEPPHMLALVGGWPTEFQPVNRGVARHMNICFLPFCQEFSQEEMRLEHQYPEWTKA